MPDNVAPLEISALITGLGGGLALFLFGMRQMTENLKTVVGPNMKNLLSRLTSNRFSAALAGTVITAVIQSSSVTTVLLVGFVSAGLLGLSQSIGVIIGANIGTTVTAQIIAFQVYKYGLLMIAIGFFTDVLARKEKNRKWGFAVMGLGMIFFGMELMSNATGPLRAWPPFIEALQNMTSPLVAILIGAVFTAIVQSSSATTGIVIVLASQGFISLESGIGLIFGANIGTCITAAISAVGRPREAIQAALVHVVFNLGGVLLWMFFIPQFADIIRSLSPATEALQGAERLAADTPRQIANAHTVFNLGNAFVFIWFTGPLAKLANWLVPERPQPVGVTAKYLDELYLQQPAMALDQVRRELVRVGELVQGMLNRILNVVLAGTKEDLAEVAKTDDDIDRLHGQIIIYLGKLSQQDLIAPQPKVIHEFVGVANYLENIGDAIDKNLSDDARKRIGLGLTISQSTVQMLRPIEESILEAYSKMLMSLKSGDRQTALEAIESKEQVNQLADAAGEHLAKRLVASEPNRLAAYRLETDLIENLKRLNTLTRRIARLVLMEENGESNGDTEQPQTAVEEPVASVVATEKSHNAANNNSEPEKDDQPATQNNYEI
jgi:phosphate:Na+ symporter